MTGHLTKCLLLLENNSAHKKLVSTKEFNLGFRETRRQANWRCQQRALLGRPADLGGFQPALENQVWDLTQVTEMLQA